MPPFPNELGLDQLKDALLVDDFAGPMMDYLKNDELPSNTKKAKEILLHADQYFVHGDLLYRQWKVYGKKTTLEQTVTQLYIPVCFVNIILTNCHDHILAAHFGLQKTYHKIRQRYFWKGMYRDIDNWIRSCQSCSQRKTHRHKVVAPLVTMKVPGALFTKGTLKFALHVLCVGLACTLRARLLSVAWHSQKHALTAR